MNTLRWALCTSIVVLSACGGSRTLTERSSDEDAAVANMNLGAGYLRQGRTDLAIDRLQRALVQNPRLADAHSVIALAYYQIGSLEDAEMHYRRATQVEPDNAGAANAYAVFLCSQGRWPDAEPYFRRAADNPRYATPAAALTNAGMCARENGANDKAEQYFRQALTRNPTYRDALRNMIDLSYENKNYLQARAFVQRYLDSQPVTAPVLLMCVNVENALENASGAERCANRLRVEFQGTPELAQIEAEQTRDGR